MPKQSNAAMLRERQDFRLDQILAKMKRGLSEIRVTEERGHERLDRLIKLMERAQHLCPSDEQNERMWRIIEIGQQKLEELTPTIRVSTIDDDMDDGEITGELSY